MSMETSRKVGDWTAEQREATLKGLSIVREGFAGGEEFAATDVMHEVARLVQNSGEPTDAHALAHLLTGVANVANLLLDWIEGEALKKELLLEDVRRRLPDYEEPDTCTPTDPKWSNWDGVLRAIEKQIRELPTVG